MEGINEGDAVDADVVDKKNPPKSSSQDLPTSGRSRGSTGATGTGGGSLSSLDSSWNWNQAQTADGRTYYFNEKKQVKWTLTLEEKMKVGMGIGGGNGGASEASVRGMTEYGAYV